MPELQQQRAQLLPGKGPCTVANTNLPVLKITQQPGCGGSAAMSLLVRRLNSFPSYNPLDLNTDKTSKCQQFPMAPRVSQNRNFRLAICQCILICPKDDFNSAFLS